jgi:hypothetical protein
VDGRFVPGFAWGVVATLVMSGLMLLGVATGMSPMPKPIPLAIVSTIFGEGIPRPVLMIVAMLAHLAYGGFWGAVLAVAAPPVTIGKGIGLGIFLWLVMQMIVLPLLGWGIFGMKAAPAIAIATFGRHLVYGATFGWLMERETMRLAS